jgi:branched-chain amino acid transport system substrate-binding protein
VKLVENDKVLGLVGSTSLIDCPVNHKYYESKGFYVIEAGVPAECFTTSNMAPVNMGPRISMTGITAYAIEQGAKKVVEYNPNNPGVEYYADGPLAYAKTQGVPGVSILGPQVIQDPASEAQRLVQAAGPDGAVLVDYVAPEALKLLQAVAQQGLIDKVKLWAAGGASYDTSLISALGPEWNGKYPINVELSGDPNAPDNKLLQQLISQYAPKVPYSAFAQLGFMAGKFATEALLRMPAGTPINAQTVNAAFHDLKGVTTDILCKPWYFGDLPFHQPINTGRTINIQDGKAVEVQTCTEVPDDGDPTLKATRAYEQKSGA